MRKRNYRAGSEGISKDIDNIQTTPFESLKLPSPEPLNPKINTVANYDRLHRQWEISRRGRYSKRWPQRERTNEAKKTPRKKDERDKKSGEASGRRPKESLSNIWLD